MPSNGEEIHFDHIVTDFLGKFQKAAIEIANDPIIFSLVGAAVLIFSYFILPGIVTGILVGLYFAVNVQFLTKCNDAKTMYDIGPNIHAEKIEKIVNEKEVIVQNDETLSTADIQESTAPIQNPIYRGWINILNERYNPNKFNVDHVQTVLMRVEGNLLFLGTPAHAVRKHAFHDDPTYTNPEPEIIRETHFDLTDAKVVLRPKNLARRRWFSRKYPFCIKLSRAYNTVFDDIQEIHTQTASEDEFDEDYEEDVQRTEILTPVTTTIESEGISEGIEVYEDPVPSAAIHRATELAADPISDGYATDEEEEAAVDFTTEDLMLKKINRRKRALRIGKYRNLYLFGRSPRGKERWFHILREIVSKYSTTDSNTISKEIYDGLNDPSSKTLNGNPVDSITSDYVLYMMQNALYEKYMRHTLGKPFDLPTGMDKFGIVNMNLGVLPWQQDADLYSSTQLISIINLFASRCLFDVIRDEKWYKQFEELIQMKIATIHLPSFIETLTLNHLDIGTVSPKITNIYEPIIDEWGIWIDFEMKYEGSIKLVIETHADMSRLGMNQEEKLDDEENRPVPDNIKPRHFCDEDVPESLETSPDEDFGSTTQNEDHGPRHKKFTKKLVSAMKKIAHSKVVQEIRDFAPVKKLAETVAENSVCLNVEIKEFGGRMVVHLPPPPSDRLWWGFRTSPHIKAEGVPTLGGLHISSLSDAIVKLIYSRLDHLLVWPNLLDVVMPPMEGNKFFNQPLNQ